MGCGCGGSKRQTQTQTTQARRDGGSAQQQPPRPTGGYTWNGPKRASKPQA